MVLPCQSGTLSAMGKSRTMKNVQHRQPKRASAEQLSEHRYLELMRGVSALFAAAEIDEGAQKAAVIEDIKRTMSAFGLTVEDLR